MTFEVKTRNATGGIEYIRIEAEDRSALFAELKTRGINAVSVSVANGKAKPHSSPKAAGSGGNAPSSGAIKGLLALLVVCMIGAIVYLCVSKDKPKAVVEEAKPVVEKPVEMPPSEVVTPAVVEKAEAPAQAPEPEKPKVDPAKAARVAKLKAMTPAERMEFLFEEAKAKPIDLTSTTNRPFATGTEQVMSWIFTTRLGNMPPPMPKLPIRDEAHMAEILMAANPALEGDSEKVKEAKEMVELAKKECIKFVEQGGDVTEFLEYYRGELMQAHQEWQESQKSVLRIIREEPEIAAEYIKEVNAQLAEKGIKPVNVPPKFREALGMD